MTFGDKITHQRLNVLRLTLREVGIRLKKSGSVLDLSDYSKIERGIQFPYNKKEFLDILTVLELSNIDELEPLAMKSNHSRQVSEEELVQHLPIFIPTGTDLDKLTDFIKEDLLPNPPKK